MTSRHQILVSAENSPYMAWQCQLFHYSCVSRLGKVPVIFVHAWNGEWHSGFSAIIRAGGIVRPAPSYCLTRRGELYPVRNAPGTLLEAAKMFAGSDQYLVLCDPDMIFVREPAFPEALAADSISYLNYGKRQVQEAAREFGVSLPAADRQRESLCGGVPHIVPVGQAARLAQDWLAATDAFRSTSWETSMYAFGLAVVKRGLSLNLTHFATSNRDPDAPAKTEMVHYCYGNSRWNKRHYRKDEHLSGLWELRPEAPLETVLGQILMQIAEARNFYRKDPLW